jgi:hypothetical protein
MLDDQVVGIPGLGPVKKQVPDIGTYKLGQVLRKMQK